MTQTQHVTHHNSIPNRDVELLRKHFSHCFTKDGVVDIEKLATSLSTSEVNFSRESYGMDWLGKSYARLLASDDAVTLLSEDTQRNSKDQNKNSQNLLLKGDNLEVLKHLSHAYHEQVKMIYIDPPYNTWRDGFIYEDDRKFTLEEFAQLAGVDDEKAKRILNFVDSKSNSHSAWLTFMYPRLYIARQLLKDDGVIFISIDDNEVAQLRLLMDEIFGEENFVGEIILQTATDNNPSQISIEHEYILTYSKNIKKQNHWFGKSIWAIKIQEKYIDLKNTYWDDISLIQKELRTRIKKNKKKLNKVTHYDNVDEKWVFHDWDVANTKFGWYKYDVIHSITKWICKIPEKWFRFPEYTMQAMILNNEIVFGEDETILIKPKKRLENVKDLLRSIIYEDWRTSTKRLQNLFWIKSIFNNPKSSQVISRLLNFASSSNDLILDFFAGSWTTWDAVMQLNASDQWSRKYILVQLPEPIDPKKSATAYEFVKNELWVQHPTIFEITKERLIRAAAKIKQEHPDDKTIQQADFGFKIFQTAPIPEWYDDPMEEFDPQTTLFDPSLLTPTDIQAILTTRKTYDNNPLTQSLTPIDLGWYIWHYAQQKLYLMDSWFTTQHLKILLNTIDEPSSFSPAMVVAFGHVFQSKALREIAENLKNYTNKKSIDIDFIIRY